MEAGTHQSSGTTSWLKIKNPHYSQAEGRHDCLRSGGRGRIGRGGSDLNCCWYSREQQHLTQIFETTPEDLSVDEDIPTHIGRLLQEVSWEGNAKHYRAGGRGRENVLTAEVFQSLDFLPREAFLGRILRSAHGARAAVEVVSREVEVSTVRLLPGDVFLSKAGDFSVQPDVEIQSPSVYCLVEAKRLQSGSFQTEQLTREYLATIQEAQKRGKTALMLIVLPTPPPVRVKKHGNIEIQAAIANYLEPVIDRCEHRFDPCSTLVERVGSVVAYTTWHAIAASITSGVDSFAGESISVKGSIERLAKAALTAVAWHGRRGAATT